SFLTTKATPLVQHGGGVELDPCSSRPEPPSVLRARADCGGRLFTAKLAVVLHYLPHQLLDDPSEAHAAAVRSAIYGSVASTVGRCNGSRTRPLKPASNGANGHTLKAAPAAAIVVSESGATGETKKAAQRFSAIGR